MLDVIATYYLIDFGDLPPCHDNVFKCHYGKKQAPISQLSHVHILVLTYCPLVPSLFNSVFIYCACILSLSSLGLLLLPISVKSFLIWSLCIPSLSLLSLQLFPISAMVFFNWVLPTVPPKSLFIESSPIGHQCQVFF